jgi:hypothetical protein
MQMVHSFWSKPMLDSSGRYLTNYGNWLDKYMFHYAICLSSLLLHKFYKGKTTLITDRFGKKLLIDDLKLPYSEVIVELDCLNSYNTKLWALGKIYSYSIYPKPFIHTDYDFFLGTRFSNDFENSKLVAYMSENSAQFQNKDYQPMLDKYFSKLVLPKYFSHILKEKKRISFNAGVIGGSELPIFKDMWLLTNETIKANKLIIEQSITNSNIATGFNLIFEQYLYAHLALENNIDVQCLESEEIQCKNNFPNSSFTLYPKNHIHMLGAFKQSLPSALFLKEVLKIEGYEYYERVNRLLNTYF